MHVLMAAFGAVTPGLLLTAINPLDKSTSPHTARFEDIDSAHRWAAAYNAKGWNIYFHVNAGEGDSIDSRLSKANLTYIRAIYIDLDPPDGLRPWYEPGCGPAYAAWADQQVAGLLALRPSYLMHSGRGLQAFWLLPTAVQATPAKIAVIEKFTKALGLMVCGNGSVHDTARIMKVPGFQSFPNANKFAAGWVQPSPAQMLAGGLGRALTFDEFDRFLDMLDPHVPVEPVAATAGAQWGNDALGLPLPPVAAINAALAQPMNAQQQRLCEQIVKKIASAKGPKGSRNAKLAQQGVASREDGDASAVWWWMMHAAAEVTDDLIPVAHALLNKLGFATRSYVPTAYKSREDKCLGELGKRWPELAAKHKAINQARMETLNGLIEKVKARSGNTNV